MKPTITRDMVADAIRQLKEKSQKVTLQAIHAALGGRGSITTLVKLRQEIEAEATAPQDSDEGLALFRQMWGAAVAEGRKQLEAQMAELRAGLDAVTSENEKLEAAAIADAARVAEIQAQRDKLVDELSQANKAATDARAAGADAAGKLAEALGELSRVQVNAANEWKDAHGSIQKAKERAHELELENARLGEQRAAAVDRANRFEHERETLQEQLTDASRDIRRLEAAALDRDRLAQDLAEARREIAALKKPTKARTPKE